MFERSAIGGGLAELGLTVPNILVRGYSLATLGLEGAAVVFADGTRKPLETFLVENGWTNIQNVESVLPPGASLETRSESDRPFR